MRAWMRACHTHSTHAQHAQHARTHARMAQHGRTDGRTDARMHACMHTPVTRLSSKTRVLKSNSSEAGSEGGGEKGGEERGDSAREASVGVWRSPPLKLRSMWPAQVIIMINTKTVGLHCDSYTQTKSGNVYLSCNKVSSTKAARQSIGVPFVNSHVRSPSPVTENGRVGT